MKKYLKILLLFAVAFGVNALSPIIFAHIPPKIDKAEVETFWVLFLIFGFGWGAAELAKKTIIPSFTLQLFLGIVLHDALKPLLAEIAMAVILCKILAAVILKSGGDEVERRHFGKIAFPTIMLATVGFLLKFFVSLFILLMIGVDGNTAALVSAIIGSTDPAALIPTLKNVQFKEKHKWLMNMAISDSAINDVVGSMCTFAVIAMIKSGVDVSLLKNVFIGFGNSHNLTHLGKELLFGFLFGYLGGWIMRQYGKHKFTNHETTYDVMVILGLPMFVYFGAVYFEGSGFLAAFIAGLVADYNHSTHHFKKSLEFMEMQIDSFAKPAIFMMAGPFVSLSDLWETAGLGLMVALASVFARIIAVIVSLKLSNIATKNKITWKEILFTCVVNETGVIPIVLAVVTVAQFTELTMLMPLTAWVVIWTLGVLPAITPWWAKILGLTKDKRSTDGNLSTVAA